VESKDTKTYEVFIPANQLFSKDNWKLYKQTVGNGSEESVEMLRILQLVVTATASGTHVQKVEGDNGTSVTVANMSLSSGTYVINAKMWLSNAQTTKAHYVKCSLVVQDATGNIVDSDNTAGTVAAAQSSTIPGLTALPFVVANSFATPVTVTLNCQRMDSNAGSTSALDIKLTAADISAVVSE